MSEQTPAPLCIIVGESPANLWAIDGVERLRRGLARTEASGIEHRADGDLTGLALTDTVVLLRADHVYDNAVLAALVGRADVGVHGQGETDAAAVHVRADAAEQASRALLAGDGQSVDIIATDALAGAYNNKLRKREVPLLVRVTADNRAEVEKRLFAGSYKGVTDIVTKFVFPLPSRIVTGWAANAKLVPNHVTFVGLLCTLATIYFWMKGDYVTGLIMAWAMCLLDTVDGKLARVTLTSSKLGDVLDHGIDLIHPPFWWWAWTVGLGASYAARPEAAWVLPAIVVVYVLQRLQEGYFIKAFGIEMHIWRPFDSWFRGITARRDVNLLFLTIAWAIGQAENGIIALAGWVIVSFGIHWLQIIQAHIAKARGDALRSWLAEG